VLVNLRESQAAQNELPFLEGCPMRAWVGVWLWQANLLIRAAAPNWASRRRRE